MATIRRHAALTVPHRFTISTPVLCSPVVPLALTKRRWRHKSRSQGDADPVSRRPLFTNQEIRALFDFDDAVPSSHVRNTPVRDVPVPDFVAGDLTLVSDAVIDDATGDKDDGDRDTHPSEEDAAGDVLAVGAGVADDDDGDEAPVIGAEGHVVGGGWSPVWMAIQGGGPNQGGRQNRGGGPRPVGGEAKGGTKLCRPVLTGSASRTGAVRPTPHPPRSCSMSALPNTPRSL